MSLMWKVHQLLIQCWKRKKAEIKCAEWIGHHTLMLVLKHEKATGILELSTGYSWNDAQESMTINTPKGIFELKGMYSRFRNFAQNCFPLFPQKHIHSHNFFPEGIKVFRYIKITIQFHWYLCNRNSNFMQQWKQQKEKK